MHGRQKSRMAINGSKTCREMREVGKVWPPHPQARRTGNCQMVRILANNAPSKCGTSFARHIQDSCSCCWRDRRVLCTSKYSPIRLTSWKHPFLRRHQEISPEKYPIPEGVTREAWKLSRLGRVQPCGQLRNFVYMVLFVISVNRAVQTAARHTLFMWLVNEANKCFKTKQKITFHSMKLYIFWKLQFAHCRYLKASRETSSLHTTTGYVLPSDFHLNVNTVVQSCPVVKHEPDVD